MKGYKAFNPGLTCRDMQYEVGKSYSMDEEPMLCKRGFHFCETIKDCSRFYELFGTNNRVCEVEANGTIIYGNDKYVTNQLYIVRELSHIEINRALYIYDDGGNGCGYGYACGLHDGDGCGDGGGGSDDGFGDGFVYGYSYGDGDGYGCGEIVSFVGDYGHGFGDGKASDADGNGEGFGECIITKILKFK